MRRTLLHVACLALAMAVGTLAGFRGAGSDDRPGTPGAGPVAAAPAPAAPIPAEPPPGPAAWSRPEAPTTPAPAPAAVAWADERLAAPSEREPVTGETAGPLPTEPDALIRLARFSPEPALRERATRALPTLAPRRRRHGGAAPRSGDAPRHGPGPRALVHRRRGS